MGNCCGSRRLPGFNRCRKPPREATKSADEDEANNTEVVASNINANDIPLSSINHALKQSNSVQNHGFEDGEEEQDINNNKTAATAENLSAIVVSESKKDHDSIVHKNHDASEVENKSRKQSIAESLAKSISILGDNQSNDSTGCFSKSTAKGVG